MLDDYAIAVGSSLASKKSASSTCLVSTPTSVSASSNSAAPDRVHFLDNRKQRYPLPEKASFYGRVVRSVVGVRGVRMNIDDSRLIVRFRRLIT